MIGYTYHRKITKELLDSINVGDQVKCNDWTFPRTVKGVSENYFVMARNAFGGIEYTICDKRPWGPGRLYDFRNGMILVGAESRFFGGETWYELDKAPDMKEYLDSLENGRIGFYRASMEMLEYIAILKKS